MTNTSEHGHLEALGISKQYGGLHAVDDVSVETEAGVIAALIGPNGAGKTTLFQCLAGVVTPDHGTVRLGGHDITERSVDSRARLGLGRTFQQLAIFETMTVADNLLVGAENRTTARATRRLGGLLAGLIGRTVGDQHAHQKRVEQVIDLLDLGAVRDAPAGTLPTGTLRLVELGRALCHDPAVLLLDEPASGLDTIETERLQHVLRSIAATGVGVMLVEHDVQLVFDIADRVFAMAEGRLIASGSPNQVRQSMAVREAYLDIEPVNGR